MYRNLSSGKKNFALNFFWPDSSDYHLIEINIWKIDRDWCVSRQIWWGHRIPAYRRENDTGDESWIVARSEEDARRQIGTQEQLKQDEDVLDTWFSSALLPLTAMGWPKPVNFLLQFYWQNSYRRIFLMFGYLIGIRE